MSRDISDIFPENVPRPRYGTKLPRLLEHIEQTEHLVHCNAVLLQGFPPSSEKMANHEAQQKPILDKAELDWLTETERDPIEQDRFRWLLTVMVDEFIKDALKDSTAIAEIVALGPVLDHEYYRKLLSSLIKDIDEARILDVNVLQGLVQLVQTVSPKYLVPDDFVKILRIVRTRLQGTHQQPAEDRFHLTLAVSRILD
ncbi:hypothetical protein BGW39_002371, partial [Mortierella sp. 14UC]